MSSNLISHPCPFAVGDTVRIREWDDMRADNGFKTTYPEYHGLMFTEPMRRFSGWEGTIRKIDIDHGYDMYRIFFEEVLDPNHNWIIADWMVELVNPLVAEVSNDDLIVLLGGSHVS